ncbi:MAG: hypothetical protein M3Y21_08865 [Candidatus Eremiobacteraeota bacterium]|nr:hypothetical protein [Candidatus Eremiobacteraeota bacterium]
MNEKHRFTVARTERISLDAAKPLCDMYTLSPDVWRTPDGYELLLRAVNRSEVAAEKVARIYHGTSPDGLRFAMDANPVIPPGPDEADRDGCEDPTCVEFEGSHYVYYTGWNQSKLRGQLMYASGTDIHALEKRGVSLPDSDQIKNPKEATLVAVKDGTWRLFFEYARDGASRIGIANSAHVTGPWTVEGDPFEARGDSWDCWHLSTGPILLSRPQHPIMFYNGATQNAMWRIGWIEFDATYQNVIARSEDPLIVPQDLMGQDTDIAFAASCTHFNADKCYLYYSVADKDMYRVTLRCA